MNPISHYNSKYAVWTLSVMIAFGFCAYILFVSIATVNVANRVDLEKKVANLSAETSQLEFNSIALGQEIGIDKASELGFTETNSPHYVVRGGNGVFARVDY